MYFPDQIPQRCYYSSVRSSHLQTRRDSSLIGAGVLPLTKDPGHGCSPPEIREYQGNGCNEPSLQALSKFFRSFKIAEWSGSNLNPREQKLPAGKTELCSNQSVGIGLWKKSWMVIRYVLCNPRLEGTRLLAELLEQDDRYRVRAIVRESLPEGLGNCDVWIAPSQTALLYISADEIKHALQQQEVFGEENRLGSACASPLLKSCVNMEDKSALQKLISRVDSFLRSCVKDQTLDEANNGRGLAEPCSVHAQGPAKVVLCEYPGDVSSFTSRCEEWTFETTVSESKSNRKAPVEGNVLEAIADFEWLLVREFYSKSIDGDYVRTRSFRTNESKPAMDLLQIIWANDTKASVRIIEQFSLASSICRQHESRLSFGQLSDRLLPTHIAKPPRALATTQISKLSPKETLLKIDRQILTMIPGVGQKRVKNIAEEPVILPLEALLAGQARTERYFCKDKILASALQRFLNQRLLPDTESAESLLYLDFLTHRRLWFEEYPKMDDRKVSDRSAKSPWVKI